MTGLQKQHTLNSQVKIMGGKAMADLSKVIPCNPAGDALDELYDAEYLHRDWLGLSEIGNPCNRYLWLRYHGHIPEKPDSKTLRLFEHGNVIEHHVIEDMRRAGFHVYAQQREIEFEKDSVKLVGHIDGIVEGLKESSKPHLLEIKSANKASFNKLEKLRSYEQWDEKYCAQIHVNAYLTRLERIFVVVYCKDDSRIYSERIRINEIYAKRILSNAAYILNQEMPNISCNNSDYYVAKMCGFKKECFK